MIGSHTEIIAPAFARAGDFLPGTGERRGGSRQCVPFGYMANMVHFSAALLVEGGVFLKISFCIERQFLLIVVMLFMRGVCLSSYSILFYPCLYLHLGLFMIYYLMVFWS